jgi:hypothetical protein
MMKKRRMREFFDPIKMKEVLRTGGNLASPRMD